MLHLLHDFPQREYPGDYLMSRLQFRRSLLVLETHDSEGESLGSDTSIWEGEQEERRWLYRQLNRRLRTALAPLFFYFEINALVKILRFMEADRYGETGSLLDRSLLAAGLKKNLRRNGGAAEAVAKLERYFQDSPLDCKGMKRAYDDRGIQGAEELIRKNVLEQALQTSTDHDMSLFFQELIDLKNTLAVAKCVRWSRGSAPELIAGGRIRTKLIVRSVTEEGLRNMVRHWTSGESLSGEKLHPVSLEPVLYAQLLQKMTRARRVAGKVVACIEYILLGFLATRNRSLHLHVTNPEAAILAPESMVS